MINIKDTFNKEFNSNIEKYNINLNIIPQSNSHEL